jgi:hypothetical protein
MFLDDVLTHVECDAASGRVFDWRGLRVASYDRARQCLVYAQPRRLVLNKANTRTGVDMVEITQRRPHAKSNRDGDGGDDEVTWSHDGVSVVCTRNHMLYVRRDSDDKSAAGGDAAFVKVPAGDVLRGKTRVGADGASSAMRDVDLRSVRMLARARNGVAGDGVSAAAVVNDVDSLMQAVQQACTAASMTREMRACVRELALPPTQVRAFVALLGCWLAVGDASSCVPTATTSARGACVRFAARASSSGGGGGGGGVCTHRLLKWLLRRCGVRRVDVVVECARSNTTTNTDVSLVVSSASWVRVFAECVVVDNSNDNMSESSSSSSKRASKVLPEWAFALSADLCRVLIAGMQQCAAGDGKSIRVASHRLRDQLVRLVLHAGYTPAFARCDTAVAGDDDVWRVEYSSDNNGIDAVEPLIQRARQSNVNGSSDGDSDDVVRTLRHYTGRTWCFDMNDGFVVVRRALRNVDGVVTHASRATIQGS